MMGLYTRIMKDIPVFNIKQSSGIIILIFLLSSVHGSTDDETLLEQPPTVIYTEELSPDMVTHEAEAIGGALEDSSLEEDSSIEQTPQEQFLEQEPLEEQLIEGKTSQVSLPKNHPAETQTPPREHSLPTPTQFDAEQSIQYWIKVFSSEDYNEWRQGVYDRSQLYMGFIESRIEDWDLPWELAYLPVIESAFRVGTRSSSGAAGLWQFMMNSIGPYEMKVDFWRDDRRDFWLSTEGALKKLKFNYDILGDWYLALAAYNCGLGRVTRTIESSGINDFWELKEKGLLPRETQQYVPRFLAAAHLFGFPENLDIETDAGSAINWVRIPLDRTIDLRLLAIEAGIDENFLTRTHAELKYPISPPANDKYSLKVPANLADSVREALMGQDELIRYHIHTIRSGDTFSALAKHFGVSVAMIQGANPGLSPTLLRIGQEILIPALKDVEPFHEEEQKVVFSGSYEVQPGDSLWSLSRRHGISPEVLARGNGLDVNGVLPAGAIIKIP